ncbi:MAG: NYN domain-containing protein [Rubrivivax sp.]|jgi:uncharacterized protein (TIGR00288 family)
MSNDDVRGDQRVMLLIDADNVSVDVMEQAVDHLMAEYGALHVRRAYCTAESALKHQQVFKRLSIRPMVNLAAGKNSTDIALAVDALDLVLAERPDVVVIASSDSDFAPLVSRLREKGCHVRGIGQKGKTGEETLSVYDSFTVLAHRRGGAREEDDAAAGSRGRRTRGPAKSSRSNGRAAERAADRVPEPAPEAARAPKVAIAPPTEPAAEAPAPAPAPAPARAPRSRSRRAREAPAGAETVASALPAAAPAAAPASAPAAAAVAPPAPTPTPMSDEVRSILAALPELHRGQTVELRLASERLRDAGLLGPRASSTRFFKPLADRFELLPPDQPNHVRWRGPDAG